LNAIPGNDDIKNDISTVLASHQQHIQYSHQDSVCRHIKQFEEALDSESTRVDNILTTLRQYYKDIKTRHQLYLEVPAGFRQESILQHQVLEMTNSTTFLPESSDLSADILESSLSDSK
jgi:DNA-binding SARP family transcriptional activator